MRKQGLRQGLRKSMALLTAIAVMGAVAGCAPDTGKEEAKNMSQGNSQAQAGQGATEVLFWHSMSGANQEKLMKVVDGFNSSQSEVHVTAENQGSYDESTSKFFNMNGGEGSPAVIQIGEQNLQSMIDSGLIGSITDMIQDYNYDQSQLLPAVVNFYSVDGVMYAMPFNASSPVLYYNVEAMKNAGYEKAPGTFEGILEAGEKISAANDGMKAFSKPVYGYALDQMVTNMGGLVVDNNNGRSARTGQVAYQDQILTIFTWLHDLVEAGQFENYGTNSDNVITGFNQKDIAMFIYTSASAARIIEGASFEVGIMPLPAPEGVEPQGVYAGGGALCVSKGLPENVRAAAMKFMEYATSPEVQAAWAGDTGYFPINTKAYETETMKQIYEKTPQLKVAADQLLTAKQTKATAGPLLSRLPQLRNDLQAAEEMVFNGGDPKAAMDQAIANTNRQIEAANKSIKK